jgi:transcriptional activator of cad operon
MLRIGDWRVDPKSSEISRDGETARVEARTMRLLLCLAEHAGEVVSIDDLLTRVWPGVSVSQDSVYQAVTSLRRLLGDDPRQPTYIATVPRLGYRMVATVGPWINQSDESNQSIKQIAAPETSENQQVAPATIDAPAFGRPRRVGFTGFGFKGAEWIAGAVLCIAIAGAFLLHGKIANGDHSNNNRPNNNQAPAIALQPKNSIAVLPFLDLTEGMKEGEFADGMTEELIDKLSKIPDFRVPAPTSSFYFKDKQIPVADIARTLGVAYVLDGSVRKSGARLRVAARLIRADSGYVIWSETYDRPLGDILMIQDDIAGEVAKALRASIEVKPDH